MSDIENLEVTLGNYPDSEATDQDNVERIDIDTESDRRQQDIGQNGENYRTLLNTNLSENSEITLENSRMINSELSSQMSRKIVELKPDLNSHILEVRNTAIEEKILPSIEGALAGNRERDAKWDLRSGGRHPDGVAKMTQDSDLRSRRRQKCKSDRQAQVIEENFPRVTTTTLSNQKDHHRENSVKSDESDEEGYNMVTGANLTPHIVPEFLTGRPMHPKPHMSHKYTTNDDMLHTTLPAQQNPVHTDDRDIPPQIPIDPINRLADESMGMKNKTSTQILMVHPVSTTALTLDGKSEKFELFEDLFHTMIKMQPDMTETMKRNHFHSLLKKMHCRHSVISVQQIDKP